MGVKSTQTITREDAETLAFELRDKLLFERKTFVWPYYLTDLELAYELESMDDELNDGESFRNYRVDRHAN